MKRLKILSNKYPQPYVDSTLNLIQITQNKVNNSYKEIIDFVENSIEYTGEESDKILDIIQDNFDNIKDELNKIKNKVKNYEVGEPEIPIYNTFRDLYYGYGPSLLKLLYNPKDDINEFLENMDYKIVDDYEPHQPITKYLDLKVKKI